MGKIGNIAQIATSVATVGADIGAAATGNFELIPLITSAGAAATAAEAGATSLLTKPIKPPLPPKPPEPNRSITNLFGPSQGTFNGTFLTGTSAPSSGGSKTLLGQ